MRKNNFTLIFLPLLLVGCQHIFANESNQAVFINDSYFDELDPVAIAIQRDEIHFESGRSADNCRSYLKEIKQSSVAETVNDQIIHTEYMICEVYDLVKGTKIVSQKFSNSYGSVLANKLDLTSFRSSLNRRARTDGPVLKDIGEQFLTTDSSSVTYETEEWFYRLEVVAISDFNRDGVKDWIVLLDDQSKVGNYHAGASLVVLGPTDIPLLKATTYSTFKP